ncbi:low molecular weight protein-tyrosine-phosphatase [Luteolibacter marinus]|uniref:low molecular weight protein-tyrosine-phosphatase n=1 Tax=Luteolibacter marinus TaxID=2776705 RepID=UPI001865FFB6|nr:low molecular weight protein-tyrosine-phosphatase [Luteolibacter marinus]
MPADRKPYRVLFVCMGNICRSPAAEIVFRKMVDEAGLNKRIEIDSAGTIGFHAGKGPDPRMAETLRRRGYPIAGRSRQFRVADLVDFDLILAADQENLSDLRRLDRDGSFRNKIQLLVDYCQDIEADHVPDPYYGGDAGFEHVADIVEDACGGLLERLSS